MSAIYGGKHFCGVDSEWKTKKRGEAGDSKEKKLYFPDSAIISSASVNLLS